MDLKAQNAAQVNIVHFMITYIVQYKTAYLTTAYTIKVVKMKSMEIPAPTNTISSKENGSKYNKLSPEALVSPGFLTLYTKETKTAHQLTFSSPR